MRKVRQSDTLKAMHYSTAMRLFVEEEISLHAISKKLDVPYRAMCRWSAEGKWSKAREEFRQSSASAGRKARMILDHILKQIDIKRQSGVKLTPGDMDNLAKATAALEKIDSVMTPRRAFVMFASQFGLWCKEMFPEDREFLARLSDCIQGYGNAILEGKNVS